MRAHVAALALVLALGACRQVLGIPGEGTVGDDLVRFPVTVTVDGVVGASASVALDVALSDGSSERVVLVDDDEIQILVPDGLAYAIRGPAHCDLRDEAGEIAGASPALPVVVACDGLAGLVDPGFTAPVAMVAASDSVMVRASMLVQQTSLAPVARNAAATIELRLGTVTQPGADGVFGPFPFAASTIEIDVRYGRFMRTRRFILDPVSSSAQYGYGKADAPRIGSRFGAAVATDGDVLVVGAPGPIDDSAPGRAYVFRRSGTRWGLEQELAGEDTAGDQFGAAVAVRGGTIIVGAPAPGRSAGAAYLFTFDGTWQRSIVELPATAGATTHAGAAVALDATHVYVGAPGATNDTGQVYRCDAAGQGPMPLLAFVVPAPSPGARFGASVAASGGVVAIGAPRDATIAPAAGAAFFLKDGLFAGGSLGSTQDGALGTSVATNGQAVVVGWPLESSSTTGSVTGIDPTRMEDGAPRSGAAIVFRWDAGIGRFVGAHVVKAPNVGADDNFGASMAFAGSVLVIGSPYEDSSSGTLTSTTELSSDSGAAYAYAFDAAGELIPMTPSYLKAQQPGEGDAFGTATAVSREDAVVGAPFDNSLATGWNGQPGESGADTGAVFALR